MEIKVNNWDKENIQFFFLFLLSILFVYKAPFILNQAFFLVILFLTYNSKKDYFWIAFFFLLIDAPGNLFTGGTITDIHRLAYYNIIPGVTISFTDIFIIVMMIKLFVQKRKYYFKFKNDIIFLLIFGIIVFVYSLIFGMSGANIIQTLRIFLGWSIFFIAPRFLLKEDDYEKILRLLFPFVFLAVISQFYSYISGNYFAYSLKGETFGENYLLISESSDEASRAADSSFILFFCFTNALFYLLNKQSNFSKSYLYIIAIMSCFSVFLSATRGWILGYLLMIVLVMLFFNRSRKNIWPILMRAAIIIIIVAIAYPKILIQISKSTDRLLTIEALAAGDITAQGTLSRLDERGPRVLSKFYESPVLGQGFSNDYYGFVDKHVGQHSLLLNLGILGFIILNIIFIKWCININNISKFKIQEKRPDMKSAKIFMFALLGMYVIHSTSAQAWGFDISITHLLFYALILQRLNLLSLNQFVEYREQRKVVILSKVDNLNSPDTL